jgi:hypothetical protein
LITIEFKITEDSLSEDMLSDPSHTDVAILEETYFIMPVRACVNGVDMLAPTGWAPMPLLGFARRLYEAAQRIAQVPGTRCYVPGGGDLQLRRIDCSEGSCIESPIGSAVCEGMNSSKRRGCS